MQKLSSETLRVTAAPGEENVEEGSVERGTGVPAGGG